MTACKRRSASEWLASLFDAFIHMMVSCFVLGIVLVLAVVVLSDYHYNPLRGRLPSVGPRVPIPNVDAATLLVGKKAYQKEECRSCHTLTSTNSKGSSADDQEAGYPPDLTHEGERNASIDWQIDNLRDHHRIFSGRAMPDYNDLPADELRALASFMATRK